MLIILVLMLILIDEAASQKHLHCAAYTSQTQFKPGQGPQSHVRYATPHYKLIRTSHVYLLYVYNLPYAYDIACITKRAWGASVLLGSPGPVGSGMLLLDPLL